jgi:hypothetical protein
MIARRTKRSSEREPAADDARIVSSAKRLAPVADLGVRKVVEAGAEGSFRGDDDLAEMAVGEFAVVDAAVFGLDGLDATAGE